MRFNLDKRELVYGMGELVFVVVSSIGEILGKRLLLGGFFFYFFCKLVKMFDFLVFSNVCFFKLFFDFSNYSG